MAKEMTPEELIKHVETEGGLHKGAEGLWYHDGYSATALRIIADELDRRTQQSEEWKQNQAALIEWLETIWDGKSK
jgi:hypothetical protein